MDGCLVQSAALMTLNDDGESNPFLFQMFFHGYEAFVAEETAQNDARLRGLGFDPEQADEMSPAEIDAWLAAKMSDPDWKARMEAEMAAHPEEQDQLNAKLAAMERDSINLLTREDSHTLRLAPQELEPWVPALLECLERDKKRKASGSADTATPTALLDSIRPIIREMAGSLFTPERIQELVVQLTAYRDELFAAGEREAAGWAMGGLVTLETETSPADNHFLNCLCLYSLRGPETESLGMEEEN